MSRNQGIVVSSFALIALCAVATAQNPGVRVEIYGSGLTHQYLTQPVSAVLSQGSVQAIATAESNLANGQFHDLAEVFAANTSDTYAAGSTSDMTDFLTLQGPGSAAVPVTLTLHVDGVNSYDKHLTIEQSQLITTDAYLGFGGHASEFAISLARNYGMPDNFQITKNIGTVTQLNASELGMDVVLSVTQMMTPGEQLEFGAQLMCVTDCFWGPGASQDYMNTGQMGLTLPTGYSFTSASGVFLSSVPEPASLWGLGGALFGLGLFCRRRPRRP